MEVLREVWRGCLSRRHGGHGGGELKCRGRVIASNSIPKRMKTTDFWEIEWNFFQ